MMGKIIGRIHLSSADSLCCPQQHTVYAVHNVHVHSAMHRMYGATAYITRPSERWRLWVYLQEVVPEHIRVPGPLHVGTCSTLYKLRFKPCPLGLSNVP